MVRVGGVDAAGGDLASAADHRDRALGGEVAGGELRRRASRDLGGARQSRSGRWPSPHGP